LSADALGERIHEDAHSSREDTCTCSSHGDASGTQDV
jgi:hypothetical protein